MGLLLRPTPSALVSEQTREPGVELLVRADGARLVWDLCQLVLDEASPLTPRAARSLRPKPGEDRVRLDPGVYWLRRQITPEEYLLVDPAAGRLVSKSEAYCHLGAVEALKEMGLEDAAISLRAGDFDLASVQVLEELARRRERPPS